MSAANEQVTTRAAGFIDETAERLERELKKRRDTRSRDDESHYESRRSRRHRRRQERWRAAVNVGAPGYRTSKLYRDPRRQRIAGVCAGFARYFGVEVWVVRGIAITGVIFMPALTIPAYIIAMLVIPKFREEDGVAVDTKPQTDHSSPAPELGTRLSPRGSLRSVQGVLDEVELKLRRIESHVTSGQFELQRELKRIDV
ncbi:MAG TPA: PspC domain-containing protein [Pseudomonadales bacterium]